MPKLTEAGDIKDFSISSNSKQFSIDISPSVVEFRYFESVLSNTITATAVVIDTGVQEGSKIERVVSLTLFLLEVVRELILLWLITMGLRWFLNSMLIE